jgi:hypothetical protein
MQHNHARTILGTDGKKHTFVDPCNRVSCRKQDKPEPMRCKVKPIAVAQPHGMHEPIWTGGNAARLECIEDIRKVFRFDTEDRLHESLAWHASSQRTIGMAS